MILKVSGGNTALPAADERNDGNRKANIPVSHENKTSQLGKQNESIR